MNDLKARDWFTDPTEFRQLCGDAVSQARSEGDQDFAHDVMKKANDYGLETFLTERQMKNLCRIADHEVPRMVSR